MHSKFIMADGRHFYLGSANLDWRSLTQVMRMHFAYLKWSFAQKMELGVLVRDCPCLSQDLIKIFDVYWRAAEKKTATDVHTMVKQLPPARYNAQRPLKIFDGEHRMAVHLSVSFKKSRNILNGPHRSR